MDHPRFRRRRRARHRLERSLTLLQRFLLASALILVAGGAALGWLLTRTLETQALDAERSKLTLYVDGVLGPTLVRDGRVAVTRWGDATIRKELRAQPELVSVKVWRADGTLAWTNRARGRIGRRFPLEGDLAETLESGRASADIVGTNAGGEHAVEARLGFGRLFEVYAPIRGRAGGTIGAYEIYASPRAVDELVRSKRWTIWGGVALVFVALWAVLALLVRSASRMLRRQNDRLRRQSARLAESNRLLAANALEAVETLNATVDAKDPYTAGHSQRVQRIAVAVGEELGLAGARLDILRFAGLFHDIGKIAVPDAVLLKPAPLTPDEYALIKRHPEDGARIVGRLHRLEGAVPAIRHHHERWDGLGYPGGLAADEIPLEAAVVGLADAWDAMTTERPYSPELAPEVAAAEIVRCSGTQFAPAVVDAFLRVLERNPSLLGVGGVRAPVLAV